MSETNPKQTFLSERLTEEYERQQALFSAQPAIVQRFLEAQAKQIAPPSPLSSEAISGLRNEPVIVRWRSSENFAASASSGSPS